MAELKSGVWIMLLLVYFTIFFIVVSAAETATNDLNDDINDNNFGGLLEYEACDEPRSKWNPDGSVEDSKFTNDFRCDESVGVNSEQYCELLDGCSWAEITEKFLWVFTVGTYYTCNGTINYTAYGINSSDIDTYFFSGNPHLDFSYSSVCVYPSVIDNRSACQIFGCTWVKFEPDINTNRNPIKVIDTIKDVFSFSYDFGLTNSNLTLFIYVIFVILPLFMLIFAIWFTIR